LFLQPNPQKRGAGRTARSDGKEAGAFAGNGLGRGRNRWKSGRCGT